ncbi:MAG: L-histidine N(alpha)-methyltransferase [Candidatus Hydrogenedentota bacterium]|nr:MAG: L-histidine N(alpha)-methyltransferase [Candidatus Hydrogenedentota bacterium]
MASCRNSSSKIMKTATLSPFAKAVLDGMQKIPKQIPSLYFYDEAGSQLFEQIMQLPEYYLTNAEKSILQNQSNEILSAWQGSNHISEKLQIIELGAGNGEKTIFLLKSALSLFPAHQLEFIPIDISQAALEKLSHTCWQHFPQLSLNPVQGDYWEVLEDFSHHAEGTKKLVLFLGSNIGNMTWTESIAFYKKLFSFLKTGDAVLTGFDLKKDIHLLIPAYNDSSGVTREFNLNLLRRMNRELGATFALEKWDHYPIYNPVKGAMESYLISKEKQTVVFKNLNCDFHFEIAEPILTEVSFKYSFSQINDLAKNSGFALIENFTDAKQYFVDSLWVKS